MTSVLISFAYISRYYAVKIHIYSDAIGINAIFVKAYRDHCGCMQTESRCMYPAEETRVQAKSQAAVC